VWAALAVLAGGIYISETRDRSASIQPEDERNMFDFSESDVGQVDLFFRGRLASLLRSPGGLWFQHDASHRHNPNPGAAAGPPADPNAPVPAGTVDANEPHPEPDPLQAEAYQKAIDFMARMVYDRRITPTEPLSEYGLANPQIVIILYPRNPDNTAGPSPLASFYVGSPLSHNQSYYAQKSGDRDVALIPLYHVNTLTQLTVGEVAQAPLRPLEINPTNR
jgi:hypothetical protein